MSVPNANNMCGGNYQDWLEVCLTDKCQGKCAWCVDRAGWHPANHAPWEDIARAAIRSERQNIMLLGGEPTQYPMVNHVIDALAELGRSVYMTTNGWSLRADAARRFRNLAGLNVSIHHFDLNRNAEITGIRLIDTELRAGIKCLHSKGIPVRFNCNCIAGQIDSKAAMIRYVKMARARGASKVRFAELKNDDGSFVDLREIFRSDVTLSDDPFTEGCSTDITIDGMPVNIRQMCGLHTKHRPPIVNPKQQSHPVLYYDGVVYPGWQVPKEEDMDNAQLMNILEQVANKQLTVGQAYDAVRKIKSEAPAKPPKTNTPHETGAGCVY